MVFLVDVGVEDILDRAGVLKSQGEPFARPVLMAAFTETDPDKKAFLLMAYHLYKAYDHARGDKMVELAGYKATRLYSAVGPIDDVIKTAYACIEEVAPSAPVPSPNEISPLPVTLTGNTRTWKTSYAIARAASTLISNGLESFGDYISEIAKDVVVGHTNTVKERIPAVNRIIAECFTGEITKEQIAKRLDLVLDVFDTDEDQVHRAVKELQKALQELEHDTVLRIQPTLQHLSDIIESETLDHPKNADYMMGPYLRVPELPASDANPPPIDPDKAERYVEELKAAYNVRNIPYPTTGAYGMETSRFGTVPDLVHWLLSRYRSNNVPAAAIVYYDKDKPKLGVRYWPESHVSYNVWMYPDVEVEEPNHTTQDGIDPKDHEKIILEAPELPM